jgi:hypothetical protein
MEIGDIYVIVKKHKLEAIYILEKFDELNKWFYRLEFPGAFAILVRNNKLFSIHSLLLLSDSVDELWYKKEAIRNLFSCEELIERA